MGSGNLRAEKLVARGLEAGRHEQLSDFLLRSDELDLDGGEALIAEAKDGGSGAGKVDDAAFRHGTAVVDGNDHRLMIPQVGDPKDGAEGQGAMSAGELVFVERLAAGGGATLKEFAVPGGDAELVPVMMGNDDLRVEVSGRRSSLCAGNAQNGGKKCAGKTEGSTRSNVI